jgi:hypothetical protein
VVRERGEAACARGRQREPAVGVDADVLEWVYGEGWCWDETME